MIRLSAALAFAQVASAALPPLVVNADAWRIMPDQSGPVNYYSVVKEGTGSVYVHSDYAPGTKTAVIGWQLPEADRNTVKKLRWTWRARALPRGGDECVKAKADSAAVVYVTFKRGLKHYALKYVWSAVGTKGKGCDAKRTMFVAQDTIILETGGPLGVWKTEEIDLADEFRRHFANGDPNAEVPPFVGLGLMSDGDQTNSKSSADFGAFTLIR